MRISVHTKKRRPVKGSTYRADNRRRVVAADEDNEVFGPGIGEVEDDVDFHDTLDDVADTVSDIQDVVEEIDEDDVDIEVDNNITNHYIAECDACHQVFISAMIMSDQVVEKISGVCPLCEKESDQYLKWIIKDAKATTEEV